MDLTTYIPQFLNVRDRLAATNQQIIALETAIRNDSTLASEIASDVVTARAQQNDLANKFSYAYGAVFGTAPTGLQGLGSLGVDPITITAAVALLVVVLAGLYVLENFINGLNQTANARIIQAQTQAALIAQAAQIDAQAQAAQDSGDTTSANALRGQAAAIRGQAGTPNPSAPNVTEWLTTNWPWVAIAAGGAWYAFQG
jgi:hypothetical protein